VEFEHDCNGVGVTGEVNKVLKLVNVCLYILFALEVPIDLSRMSTVVASFSGQNIDANSPVKSLHDVKHIFPDRSS
jgi:hypothetical protein